MAGGRCKAGYAEVNGTRMYYEVAGEGDPLVLVHAGIADCRMWDDQLEALAKEFTVVRYDMRGFGRTPAVQGPFAHHRDLKAVLDHLGIARAALLGCSIGGRTIIDFALESPDAATALIAVASGVSGYASKGGDPTLWGAAVAAYERGDLRLASEYEVQIWVDGPRRTSDQVPAAIRDRVREMNLIPLAVPDELVDERPLEPPATGRLQEIRVPTLVIVGELDQPEVIEQCALISERVSAAETVRLPTAHLPNMERPDEFNDVVLAFLRRVRWPS